MKDKFEIVRLLKRDDPSIIRFLAIDDSRIKVLLEKAIKKFNERMTKND